MTTATATTATATTATATAAAATAARHAEFTSQVRPCLPQLHHAALRMTRNTADADDLVQDTLTRAYTAYHQYTPGTNLRAWLHKILATTYINTYRKAQRRPQVSTGPLDDDWHASTDPLTPPARSAEDQALAKITDPAITAALHDLPREFRTAIYLADIEGYPYRDVATLMGTPLGTVMSRLHRGRGKLRHTLAHHAPTPRTTR